MSNVAVILGAGNGTRMKCEQSKLLLKIKGKTVIERSVEAFLNISDIDEVIVVARQQDIDTFISLLPDGRVSFAIGGDTRQQSVYNAIQTIDDDELIAIHDGARPFVTEEILKRGLQKVKETGACVIGMPSKDTVKLSDEEGYVKETPNRKCVWTIQTPQIFSYSLIREAHDSIRQKDMSKITDDAMVVEQETGAKVALAEGSYQNIKITTPEDLDIAEAFLKH